MGRDEDDFVFTSDAPPGVSSEPTQEDGSRTGQLVHLLPALVILVLAMFTAPPDLGGASAAAEAGAACQRAP